MPVDNKSADDIGHKQTHQNDDANQWEELIEHQDPRQEKEHLEIIC